MSEGKTARWLTRWWDSLGPMLSALLTVIPHAPVLAGRREFFYDDHFRFTTPLAKLVTEILASGHLPLWNPWVLTGTPLVAERGGMVAHPGLWLAFFFEPSHAVGILMVVFLGVLAGGATAFLSAMGVGRGMAMVAGAALGICGPAISLTSLAPYLATLAFYPLALYSALRLARGQGAGLLGGFALGMAFLGGDLPGASLLGLFYAGFFFLAGGRISYWPRLAVVFVTAFLIGAGSLIPVVWGIPFSERGSGIVASEAGRWSFHPLEWLGFIWPHPMGLPLPRYSFWPLNWLHDERLMLHSVWIGSLTAVASVMALWRSQARLLRAMVIAALCLLVISSGIYTPLWTLVRPLFFFIRYPSKLVAPAAVLLFLAGVVILYHLCESPRALRRFCLWVASLGVLGVVVGPWLIHLVGSKVNALPEALITAIESMRWGAVRVVLFSLGGILAALVAERSHPTRLSWIMAGLVFLDVFTTTHDLIWTRPPEALLSPTFLPTKDERGPRVMRLEEVSKARIALNTQGFTEEQMRHAALLFPLTNQSHHVGLMEGYGQYSGRLGKAMHSLNAHDPVMTAELLATDVLLSSPVARAPWLVKAVDEKRLIPTHRLQAGAVAMRVSHTLPRSYLATSAIVEDHNRLQERLSRGEFRNHVLVDEGHVLRGRKLVPFDVKPLVTSLRHPGDHKPIVPTAWRPGFSSYHMNLVEPALLVEVEAFLPGWRATLDGQEIPLLEVNLMSRAVVVPGGEHVVEFHFDPPLLVASLYSSWLSLAAMLLAWVGGLLYLRIKGAQLRSIMP